MKLQRIVIWAGLLVIGCTTVVQEPAFTPSLSSPSSIATQMPSPPPPTTLPSGIPVSATEQNVATSSPIPLPAVPVEVETASFPIPTDYILYRREAETGLYSTEVRAVASDGTDDRLLMVGQHLAAFEQSVDRRYLAFSAHQPFVLDLTTGAVTVLDTREESAMATFFWLPNDVLYYLWRVEGHWAIWRTSMSSGQPGEKILDLPDGTLLLQVLDDKWLMLSQILTNNPYQTNQVDVFNWHTAERVLMQGDYWPVVLSPDLSHVILYGQGEVQEGGYVPGFYIAEIDLIAGRYANSILVNPSNGAPGYDYQPAFSPDGTRVAAKRLFGGDRFGSEMVLIQFDHQSYVETPLKPDSDRFCRLADWYDSSLLVAACRHPDNVEGVDELWLLSIDGSVRIMLTESGYPISD